MFSWRDSSHRNLSRRALRSSFLRDSSPITLSPFLSGIETRSRTSRRRSMIDGPPSSGSLIFCVVSLFFFFILAFWLLRHCLRHFVDHYPHIPVICHIVWKEGNSVIDLNQAISNSALLIISAYCGLKLELTVLINSRKLE